MLLGFFYNRPSQVGHDIFGGTNSSWFQVKVTRTVGDLITSTSLVKCLKMNSLDFLERKKQNRSKKKTCLKRSTDWPHWSFQTSFHRCVFLVLLILGPHFFKQQKRRVVFFVFFWGDWRWTWCPFWEWFIVFTRYLAYHGMLIFNSGCLGARWLKP